MPARKMSYVVGLGVASAVSVSLVVADALVSHELVHAYLVWNLFLAWVPFIVTVWLERILRHKLWSSWEALLVSLAWLIFIPNSFYLISDYVHINDASSRQLNFAVVIITSFVFSGVALGIASLYAVHREIRKRFSSYFSALIVAATLLIVSGAIYVGRDLRWNSWDILIHPFGLLFDISERILHPSQYAQVLAVVVPFFMLLATIYFVVYSAIQSVRPD